MLIFSLPEMVERILFLIFDKLVINIREEHKVVLTHNNSLIRSLHDESYAPIQSLGESTFSPRRNVLLNEIYFGTNDHIEVITQTFKKFAKMSFKGKTKDEIADMIDDLFTDIEDAVEGLTGVKTKVLIDKDESGYNAYTFCTGYDVNDPDIYYITDRGIKYKKGPAKKKRIYAFYTWDMLFNPILTPKELTACLLHEIGHNFTLGILPLCTGLDAIILALRIANRSKLASFGNRDTTDDDLQNDANILRRILDSLWKQIPNYASFLKAVGGDILDSVKYIISKLLPTNANRYADEKFADSFATMYGYGKPLLTALDKLDRSSDSDAWVKSHPFYAILEGAIFTAILILFDEHPSTSARIRTQIMQLQYELDNDKTLSKYVRKDLEKQIRMINILLKQHLEITKRDKVMLSRKIYDNIMLKLFDTGDFFGKLVHGIFNAKLVDEKIRSIDRE